MLGSCLVVRSAVLLFASLSVLASGCYTLGAPAPDAYVPIDAARGDTGVERRACTSVFGSALAPSFQRIDGQLVALVPPSAPSACRPDGDHLHLQVLVGAITYDIAVTTRSTDPAAPEVYLDEVTASMPGPAYSTGAHTGVALDYATGLGVHATDFTAHTQAELLALLESRLAAVEDIAIFATGYPGGDGAHLVHRNGHGEDGALVLAPHESMSPMLIFHFATQTF